MYVLSLTILISFFYFFPFNRWAVTNFTEHPVGDCADVGRQSLDDIAECKEAASALGFTYLYDVSSISVPKGCFKSYRNTKNVFWNSHEIGSWSAGLIRICKAIGKYISRFSI